MVSGDRDDRIESLQPLILRPRWSAAAAWGTLGLALIASGVYFVSDSRGHPLSWALLGAFLAVGGYYAAQAVVPGLVEVRLERDYVRSNLFGFKRRVSWEHVHVARVRRVGGDPMLHLEVREPSVSGDDFRHRVIAIVLPVGCDLGALHRFLAIRLGTAPRAPRSVKALEL